MGCGWVSVGQLEHLFFFFDKIPAFGVSYHSNLGKFHHDQSNQTGWLVTPENGHNVLNSFKFRN